MRHDAEWITQGNGLMRCRVTCYLCSEPVEVPDLDLAAVKAYLAGALVQDAFPGLSPSLRETITSGSHATCFDAAFPEEDDGEWDQFCDPDALGTPEPFPLEVTHEQAIAAIRSFSLAYPRVIDLADQLRSEHEPLTGYRDNGLSGNWEATDE